MADQSSSFRSLKLFKLVLTLQEELRFIHSFNILCTWTLSPLYLWHYITSPESSSAAT